MPARPKKKTVQKKTASWSDAQIAAAVAAKEKFSNQTPGAVLDALFPDGVEIAGRKVIPLSIASYTFLEKLGNPITEEGGLTSMDNFRLMELCLVLTHPIIELLDIRAEGDDSWEVACYEIGSKVPMEDLQALGFKIGTLVAQATSTVVPTTRDGKKGGPGKTSKAKKASQAKAVKGARSAG